MDDIRLAVQRYLSRGWALVPLHWIQPDGRCSCGRGIPGHVDHLGRPDYVPDHDHRQGGKHPIHGKWQQFVQRSPVAWQNTATGVPNVGIATGAPSGHWVLDFDPAAVLDEDAHTIVAKLAAEGMPPHVRTGGGGDHWRFQMPADFEVTNHRGALPAGFDVRGTGGQVVAPPSVSGKGAYVELTDAAPYVAPGWLLDMIRPSVPKPSVASTGVPGSTGAGPMAGWSPLRDDTSNPEGLISGDDRGQRYAAGALPEVLGAYARLDDGRRGEAAWATCVRLVELANLAGWDLHHVADRWLAAAATARDNAPGGLSQTEAMRTWQRAVEMVAGRPAALEPRDVLPALPVTEPGVVVPPFSSTSGAPSPGPADPPAVDPITAQWEAAVQREVNRQLVRDAARRRLDELALGERAAARDRLRAELLDGDAFLARPRLRPLVDGLLYLNTLARINGPSGHGKTHITLDLALRVARGMSWAGRGTRAGRVVVLVGEGDEGAAGRVDAWRTRYGPLGDIAFLPRPVQLVGPEWDLLVEVLAERPPVLVVADTQARHTVGIEENDNTEMGVAVAALDRLRAATQCCALLVHHSAEGVRRGRGATVVKGALHTELFVSKAGDAITVMVGKDKDGRPADDVIFDLVTVPPAGDAPVEPGDVLPVVPVWREGGAVDAPAVAESARLTRARTLWNVINDRYNPGMGGTQAEIRQAFADVAFPGRPTSGQAGGPFRAAWARAWADLIQRGLIAQAHGAARFKVVVLSDQSRDGVLTSNIVDGKVGTEGPLGFDVILTDVTESQL